ncbi:hypothetical protein PORY_000683 [Pneumocystis oryctolagi]|uniref:Uncharacterized protein n=1 Tax=Pneumocystis oryctolagi TaxID=42067 RepID=A0ACB7CDW0_9ASCO|nr:hypothetical protein PORY_000683 [Pneumocystis oryctolagi]
MSLDFSYETLHEKFTHLQLLEKQRKKTSLTPSSPWSIIDSQEPKNLSRNRYYDIVPYDKCRVKLIDQENDYINASYIFLPDGRKYIAAQGPLRSTVSHFWSMVWHELDDDGIILMLTKMEEHGVEKCARYLPEEGQKTLMIPEISLRVELVETKHEEQIKLEKNIIKLTKHIHHIYFKDWPDHSVPQNLHAGCGRTGTYIILDYLISALSKLKDDSEKKKFILNHDKDLIFDMIDHIRKQRMVMVQNSFTT